MKILYRYIFISILKPLAFCLTSFFFLWLIYDLFDTLPDFVSQKASPGLVFQFYAAQLPKIAQSVIPVALLFSTLYVLAYFSSHRELVVMQANGLSLAEICWPLFLIAGLLSIFLFFLNFQLTPKAELNRRLIKEKIQGQESQTLVYSNVVYRNPENRTMWYLQVINARNGTFQNGEILIADEQGRDQNKLFAKRGTYESGYWKLENVTWVRFNKDGTIAKTAEVPSMNAYELIEKPKQIVASLRPPDEMTWSELWNFLHSQNYTSPRLLAPYWTEHHYRISYPIICFILCFFGIALGVSNQRRSIAASVFNCIFVLFALLVWLHLSIALGSGGRIPSWFAAWNGIVLFFSVGFYLFAKRVGWVWVWHAKWEKLLRPSPLPCT